MTKTKSKGFTLFELLGVMAIIAVLALITAPMIMKQVEKSRVTAVVGNFHNLTTSWGAFYADVANLTPSTGVYDMKSLVDGKYSTSGTIGTAVDANSSTYSTGRTSTVTNWNGPYLNKNLAKDPWGQPIELLTTTVASNGKDTVGATSGTVDGSATGNTIIWEVLPKLTISEADQINQKVDGDAAGTITGTSSTDANGIFWYDGTNGYLLVASDR